MKIPLIGATPEFLGFTLYGIFVNDTCVYIGATSHVRQRLYQHSRKWPTGEMRVLAETMNPLELRDLEEHHIATYPNLANQHKKSGYQCFGQLARLASYGVEIDLQAIEDYEKRKALENTMADPAFQ